MEMSRRNTNQHHMEQSIHHKKSEPTSQVTSAVLKMPLYWRLILICMGLFFLMATCVQYNDPDPYLWMVAYAIPCLLSLIISIKKNEFTIQEASASDENYKQDIKSLKVNKNSNLPKIKSHSKLSLAESAKDQEREIKGVTTTSTVIRTTTSSSSLSSTCTENSHCFITTKLCLYIRNIVSLNTLIIIHILYCFVLGIWTLILFFNGITSQREIITKSLIAGKKGSRSRILFSEASAEVEIEEEEESIELIQIEMNAEEAKEIFGLCLVIAWLSLLRSYNFLHLKKIGLGFGIVLTIIPFVAWIFVEIYESKMENICHY